MEDDREEMIQCWPAQQFLGLCAVHCDDCSVDC